MDGAPVMKQKQELIDMGMTYSSNDSNMLRANFAFEKDLLVRNYKAGKPDVPEDVAEDLIRIQSVSYTHLDVYKRQRFHFFSNPPIPH